MKITFQREQFHSAYQIAASVVPARSPKPILRNVKLEVEGEQATLIATDLEVGIRTHVAVEVERPGEAVLPVDRIGPILRETSDEHLHIECDAQGITVWGAQSEFKLPSENPDEFPTVSGFDAEGYHEVPAKLLKELIRRTAYATDDESTRYALGGVLFEFLAESIVAVGTDGRRLAKMEGPAISVGGHQSVEQTIVPTRAVNLVDRALSEADAEVSVACRGNDVLVKSNRATIYSTLLVGRFPKWRDALPQGKAGMTVIDMVVGPLLAAVKQSAIVTDKDTRGVDFAFGDGRLVLSARNAEAGESRVEMPIPYEGEQITITLDPAYVSEFLRVLDLDQTVSVQLTGPESPVICRAEDGYAYVIMPLAREAKATANQPEAAAV